MPKKGALHLWDAGQQINLLADSVHDERQAIPTGFGGIDSLLRRGGLLPGSFVLLGGRTGTRKTTVMLNMMVSMATEGIPVGLMALDEPPDSYVAKLLSAFSNKSQEHVERVWDEPAGKEMHRKYRKGAGKNIWLFGATRPGPDHLEAALEQASLGEERPAVLFLDYFTLMTRSGDYKYGDNSRLPMLAEDLRAWTRDTGTVLVVLHQLSRNDEFGGANNRNAGHIPVTLTQLRQTGEEQADIVLGTFRPAMDPMALMPMDMAKMVLGDRFDEEEYYQRRSIAKKYEKSTFLQLLKNRTGVEREERGIELVSKTDSLRIEEKYAEEPGPNYEEEEEDEVREGAKPRANRR